MVKEKSSAAAIIARIEGIQAPQVLAEPSILRLHATNQRLWQFEDAVRDRGLKAAEVAQTKRAIDALNLERHAAVAAIDVACDAAFPERLPADHPRVVLNSESVGQMIDRLSILTLKRSAWAGSERAAGIEARIAWLSRCLDRILTALAAGRAGPQRFDEAKTYSA